MTRRVIIEADGGSRGNPGPAGYGAVVRDADTGEVLAEVSEGLGTTTNNVAEYSGLVAGLRAAVAEGAESAEVRMDSKLVVEQMSGRWQIKHPQLRPLASAAAALARQLGDVQYTWIPRARNGHADRLANQAMDAQAKQSGSPRSGSPRSDSPHSDSPHSDSPHNGNPRNGNPRNGNPSNGNPRGSKPTDSSPRDSNPQNPKNPGTASSPPAKRASPTGSPSTGPSSSTGRNPDPANSSGAQTARSGAQTAPPAHWTGSSSPPTRLLLLRHAQTEYSAQRRYSGLGDLPLTELGERQAAAAAARLAGTAGVAAVISSPLLRARQTAKPVADALGVPLVVQDELIETDFGAWEGLTFAEARERDPDVHAQWLVDTSVAPPGGESMDVVQHRVRRARAQLIAEHGAGTLVVVTHVTPIKMFLRMALDAGPSLLYRLYLDLASLSIAEFYPDGPAAVTLVNDTSHLP